MKKISRSKKANAATEKRGRNTEKLGFKFANVCAKVCANR